MAMIKKSIELNGQTLTIETGRIAKQAGGAVLISMGESVVLVAATGNKKATPGRDFLPLTCEYRPNSFASGRIPGGYFKREGRPGPKSILVARLMDRPMRPLFPKTWRAEIQLFAQPVSHDIENNTDVLAVTGASCAAHISDVPFDGPIACVRVGRVDGEFIANPTKTQLESSDFNMVLAATSDAITMVEGGMEQASEEDVVAALEFGFAACQPLIQLQKDIAAECAKEKMPIPEAKDISELVAQVEADFKDKIVECFGIAGKHERSDAISAVKKEAVAAIAGEDADEALIRDVKDAFGKVVKTSMRTRLIATNVRMDGRGPSDIRDISVEVGVLPRVHGSALFTRGETQALVTTTLGTRLDEKRIDEIDEQGWSKFFLHYNFPSYSVGECRRISGPGRREIGHGMLAQRAVTPVVPDHEDFSYTIRVVSDITESNGSSSMASVCGASLAMMDAGVPVKAPCAGIAMPILIGVSNTLSSGNAIACRSVTSRCYKILIMKPCLAIISIEFFLAWTSANFRMPRLPSIS